VKLRCASADFKLDAYRRQTSEVYARGFYDVPNCDHSVICVYEADDNVIETHEHAGDSKSIKALVFLDGIPHRAKQPFLI
jgi:hypothetical protein